MTVLTIDMDKCCAECRKPGATGSGVCLRCVTRSMDIGRVMRSPQGQAVQQRMMEVMRKARKDAGRDT